MKRGEIRAALLMADTSQISIAKSVGVKPASVSLVISGRMRSRRIEQAISQATGIPLETLFPDRYTTPGARNAE